MSGSRSRVGVDALLADADCVPGRCVLRGSNGSITICSVPLISARQNGQPCPSESYNCIYNIVFHLYIFPKFFFLNKNEYLIEFN